MDIKNVVEYYDDPTDPLQLGISEGGLGLASGFNSVFKRNFMLGEAVAVNGRPTKGLFLMRSTAPRDTGI